MGLWIQLYHLAANGQERYICFVGSYEKSDGGEILVQASFSDEM
jgi:hypothetical protein